MGNCRSKPKTVEYDAAMKVKAPDTDSSANPPAVAAEGLRKTSMPRRSLSSLFKQQEEEKSTAAEDQEAEAKQQQKKSLPSVNQDNDNGISTTFVNPVADEKQVNKTSDASVEPDKDVQKEEEKSASSVAADSVVMQQDLKSSTVQIVAVEFMAASPKNVAVAEEAANDNVIKQTQAAEEIKTETAAEKKDDSSATGSQILDNVNEKLPISETIISKEVTVAGDNLEDKHINHCETIIGNQELSAEEAVGSESVLTAQNVNASERNLIVENVSGTSATVPVPGDGPQEKSPPRAEVAEGVAVISHDKSSAAVKDEKQAAESKAAASDGDEQNSPLERSASDQAAEEEKQQLVENDKTVAAQVVDSKKQETANLVEKSLPEKDKAKEAISTNESKGEAKDSLSENQPKEEAKEEVSKVPPKKEAKEALLNIPPEENKEVPAIIPPKEEAKEVFSENQTHSSVQNQTPNGAVATKTAAVDETKVTNDAGRGPEISDVTEHSVLATHEENLSSNGNSILHENEVKSDPKEDPNPKEVATVSATGNTEPPKAEITNDAKAKLHENEVKSDPKEVSTVSAKEIPANTEPPKAEITNDAKAKLHENEVKSDPKEVSTVSAKEIPANTEPPKAEITNDAKAKVELAGANKNK